MTYRLEVEQRHRYGWGPHFHTEALRKWGELCLMHDTALGIGEDVMYAGQYKLFMLSIFFGNFW